MRRNGSLQPDVQMDFPARRVVTKGTCGKWTLPSHSLDRVPHQVTERCRLQNHTSLSSSPAWETHVVILCGRRLKRCVSISGLETLRDTTCFMHYLCDLGRMLTLSEPCFSH